MARRKPKNKKPSESYKHYKIVEGKLLRDKTCPRCGVNFLAVHSNRLYCGSCHYTEFKTKEAKK